MSREDGRRERPSKQSAKVELWCLHEPRCVSWLGHLEKVRAEERERQ